MTKYVSAFSASKIKSQLNINHTGETTVAAVPESFSMHKQNHYPIINCKNISSHQSKSDTSG
jgi:hypothetical protein